MAMRILLVDRARELGAHLGPILVQLPPDLELDLPALEETLDAFPVGLAVAVEPRHSSWFVEGLRCALADRSMALCVADRLGPITPFWQTADWTYLRFHAGLARPRPCDETSELRTWAERIGAAWGRGASGFAFFNNDGNGCALRDAGVFGHELARHGVTVTSQPLVPADVLVDPRYPLADGEGRAPVAVGRAWGAARSV